MLRKLIFYLAAIVGTLAFAALFIVLFANSLDVHCTHPPDGNPTCTISRMWLGKIPRSSQTVADIVRVKEDKSCDADSGCSYRALLITSSGQSVPFNDVYTDQSPVGQQMDAINAFLSGQTGSFDYAEDVPWWVVELIGGLGLMTIVILTISFFAQWVKRR